MLGIERLEEKLAETKDPIARKQLQELLDKRKKQEKQMMWWVVAIVVALTLSFIATRIMNAYYLNEEYKMKIEHIRWQSRQLNR